MTIDKYGKRDLSQGLYQDIHRSSTHETTRLLEDTVRIADEIEETGAIGCISNSYPYQKTLIKVLLKLENPQMITYKSFRTKNRQRVRPPERNDR